MDTLADRLDQAMKAKNLSAPALGDALGATKQTVYNVLNGTTKPDKIRAETLFDLSRALGVAPEWLLYGRDSARPASQLLRPDPDILHAALTLLVYDEDPMVGAGAYRPREQAVRLADLYEWVAREGGRLSAKSNAQFLEQVEARRAKKGAAPNAPHATESRRSAG